MIFEVSKWRHSFALKIFGIL